MHALLGRTITEQYKGNIEESRKCQDYGYRIWKYKALEYYIDGLVQDCSDSSALAMESVQSCTKPSI